MNKQKIIWIVAGAVALIVIAVLLFFALNGSGKSVKVGTKTGSQISVNDFYQNAQSTHDNSVDIMSNFANGQYEGMAYDESTKTFTLSFNAVDFPEFQTQRVGVEQRFVSLLGVNNTDACKLKVEERNTPSPDPDLDGKVFGLSFCK